VIQDEIVYVVLVVRYIHGEKYKIDIIKADEI
jgi:hypothetical protein